MFCELIINAIPEMVKFFQQLDLYFYFTKPQIKHMQAFIVAMMLNSFGGKITHVSDLSLHSSRTSIGRFLDSDSWNEAYLLQTLNKHVITTIYAKAKETNLPIYAIIDDTICEKAVPSSKAKQPISGCSFHMSHLHNKMVYGHQFVTVMLRCGDLVLPYNIVLYEKEVCSKIEVARLAIISLPKPVSRGYVLTDSWYSCQTLFEAAQSVGYEFIGAVKSNRLIFPRGNRKKGVQIGTYARSLRFSDLDYVTVNGQVYYTYTYLGKINGMRKVKIVISWPKDALFLPKAMKAFISTDIKMSGRQLLHHYTKRWPIEVFFREANRRLGMKHCQVHSNKAVIRYQYILMLCYTFCGLEINGDSLGFSKTRRVYQNAIERFHISWIYQQAQNNVDLSYLYSVFKLNDSVFHK